jgi:hypothetical protein
MLEGDTAIQAQRDVIIIRQGSGRASTARLLILLNLLWCALLLAGWHFTPGEREIREMVAQEVPEQVRLILLP